VTLFLSLQALDGSVEYGEKWGMEESGNVIVFDNNLG
jgi:hypothetical protein